MAKPLTPDESEGGWFWAEQQRLAAEKALQEQDQVSRLIQQTQGLNPQANEAMRRHFRQGENVGFPPAGEDPIIKVIQALMMAK